MARKSRADKEAEDILATMIALPIATVIAGVKAIEVFAGWLGRKAEKYENKKKKDIVYKELDDWQKKEVNEGYHDSYNFDEEELEEDDYYYEDE